ncbi:DoxX family protein [Sphingobium sp.]|uniref:DoxX family protein n=1 Tax=Sphingobium sp. TaxID=1912891 RepID=UPI002CF8552F|nr:DoxX family protein [Sphingobium sp.]HUD90554.1 DoxX family protein [Sphingobium sp.]
MRSWTIARSMLAAVYTLAGIMHLTRPAGFVAITPHWVPSPEMMVMFTGFAELAGAMGLMFPPTRRAAGMGLAIYALCVWPANFNHALNDIPINGMHLGWGYHGPRLALQPLIIWWGLWAGGITDWPIRRRRAARQRHER